MALYRFIPLLLLALSVIFPLWGQNAKLSGQVIDPSGASIINADVHLVSEGTRAGLVSKTDGEGGFGVNLLTDRKKQVVFAEFPTIKMVRTLEWKLVHYPGAKHGELYDLKNDPHELFNLWADPKYAVQRAEMAGLLTDWLIRSQDRKLGPVRDPSEKG
jgi:arylsulfatase A-like enzyme